MSPCEIHRWRRGEEEGYDAEIPFDGETLVAFSCLECARSGDIV